MNILVVEDEIAIAEGIIFNLKRKGYQIDHTDNGRVALQKAIESNYDLILLDVRLPEIDGFEICRTLRSKNIFTPILMLTARDQADDIVFGIKSGADDYLTKPFDLAELFARIESLLRRYQWNVTRQKIENISVKYFGDFWIDFSTWQAKTLQGVVELNKKEIEVMKIFIDQKNQVVSRKKLLEDVWGLPNHPNARVVDNVIVVLRKYFETDSQNPQHILNMRGVGYKFVDENTKQSS